MLKKDVEIKEESEQRGIGRKSKKKMGRGREEKEYAGYENVTRRKEEQQLVSK